MTMKVTLMTALLLLAAVSSAVAKICYERCPGRSLPNAIQEVDIQGCRRRSSFGKVDARGRTVDFKCTGAKGPPCTVRTGDIANLTAIFDSDIPLRNLEQQVTWKTAGLPWVGLDTDACKYLEGRCTKGTGSPLNFSFGIKIEFFYPKNNYDLQWEFFTTDSVGTKTSVDCLNFNIRIV